VYVAAVALVIAEIDATPWVGLRPYTVDDARRFFGRERVVRQVARLLESRHVAGVIGPSGCGKSSILAAGLTTAGWRVEIVRPDRNGAAVLTAFAERAEHGRRAVVVDQLEQVFTAGTEQTREELTAAIVRCVTAQRPVAFALRSDHYGSCAGYPEFAELAAGAHVLIGPPTEAELRAIVLRPASLAGIDIPADLVDEIVDEMLGEPGALPLVSHVLRETFRAGGGAAMRWEAYRRAGGVRGAVAASAERVWQRLGGDEQALARSMLLQLAEPDTAAFDVGRRVPVVRLVPPGDSARREILDALAAARLVTIDGTNVELAHEAVLREWPRLRDWLAADRDRLRTLNNVRRSATAWNDDGRPASSLLRGAGLQSARQLLADSTDPVDDITRAFVEAGAAAADDELQEALAQAAQTRTVNRRLRYAIAAICVLLLLVGAFGAVVWSRSADLRAQRDVADARRLAAASGTLRADNIDLAALTAAAAFDLHHDLETTGSMLAAATAQPELRTYLHDDAAFTAVALGGDPRVVIVDDDERAFGIWGVDGPAPERIGELPAPSGGSASVDTIEVVGAAGDVAVVTDDAGGIGAYDIGSGRALWTVSLPAAVTATASTATRLAVATDDGEVRVVDTASGDVLGQVSTGDPASAMAFGPDGWLLTAASGVIVAWDGTRFTRLGTPIEIDVEVWSITIGPDHTIAIGTDTDLRLLDGDTGAALLAPVDAHEGIVHDVVFVDDSLVISSGEDGRVQFWDPQTLTTLRPPIAGHSAGVLGVAFDPVTGLLVTVGEDLRAGIWDLHLDTPVSQPIAPTAKPGTAASRLLAGHDTAVAVADDGLIAIAGGDGVVRFADGAGRPAPAPIIAAAAPITAIAITPDATVMAVATAAGTVQAFEPATGTAVSPPFAVGTRSTSVALDPTGVRLAATQTDAGCAECVVVYDLRAPTAEPLRLSPASRPPDAPARPAYAVAFSVAGDRLAFGDNAGYVDVWGIDPDAAAATPLWSTKLERGVRSLAFSHSGDRLAVGANGGLLVVLDAASGAEQQRLKGHRGRVGGVAFSPNDTLLASSGPDEQKLRVWVNATGLPFAPAIPTGVDWVTQPAWTADGAEVLVETAAGGTVAYGVDPEQLRAAMCELAQRDLTEREWRQYVGARPYRHTCGDDGE